MKTRLIQISERVAPVWPLDSFVAVNPYFGMHDMDFESAHTRLSAVADSGLLMDSEYYLSAISEGRLSLEDVDAEALGEVEALTPQKVAELLLEESSLVRQVRLGIVGFLDSEEETRLKDWVVGHISSWAASYFDKGQAILNYPMDGSLGIYRSWKEDAEIDLVPEIVGIVGFRDLLRKLPSDYLETIRIILDRFGLDEDAVALYLHRLLMQHHGWAAYVRKQVWEDGLASRENTSLLEFLAVILVMEYSVYECLADEGLRSRWKASYLPPLPAVESLRFSLQKALEKGYQRSLISRINRHPISKKNGRAKAQAVFCIDVRSEVFRRHLESCDADIETHGFAGFFGVPVSVQGLGKEESRAQCPALLSPGYSLRETAGSVSKTADMRFRTLQRSHLYKAWFSFKMGAVSCFSFIGPVGLVYLPLLIWRSFRGLFHRQSVASETLEVQPELTFSEGFGIEADDRVALARGILAGMSLGELAPVVVLVGHESQSANNPYAAGLDCGACGGHSGSDNALVAVGILNDADVRDSLAQSGVCIPDDTVFVAGVHNTTTDEVRFLNTVDLRSSHRDGLTQLKASFDLAGGLSRQERMGRFRSVAGSVDVDDHITSRSLDWSQVRPEWGLAGCAAFIAAPRHFTRELVMDGRVFLHTYRWQDDFEYKVLNLILSAPVVVASWINLQYYASSVDNVTFGSGNKTLHNVVGGMGVFEGNGGDLRVGLPMQSVSDGEVLQHEPLRLSVFVAAPLDAIDRVLAAQDLVRQLCDHSWIYLFAVSDDGVVSHQYEPGGNWCDLGGDEND